MSDDHHIIPAKVYLRTLIALLVLTSITVGAAYIDMGSPMNIIVAMIIAVIKGSIVCLFFMGLKYDRPLNTVIFSSSVFFLFCFFLFVFIDVGTRGELDPTKGVRDPYRQLKNLEEGDFVKDDVFNDHHSKEASHEPAKDSKKK
jgi:cytochrome c oxidase subunit 4